MREHPASRDSEVSGNSNNAAGYLRVALVAGALGRGGAEKQFFYLAQSLWALGVSVRVYSVTRGEPFEAKLQALGVPVHWFGRYGNPVLRMATLAKLLASYRPHVIQSGHAFTNLYAAAVGRWLNTMSLGAQRSDWSHTRERNGLWAYPLMKMPSALIANSEKARLELTNRRILKPESVRVLRNAIDLGDYGAAPTDAAASAAAGGEPVAVFVARLIAVKRLDRFLRALALASRQVPALRGIIVGDGPQRQPMQQMALDLGLSSSQVTFLGERDDVSALLRKASFLVLSSDLEGTPNVILEAMATALPVVTTPVGDAAKIVLDGVTGYVVDFDDVQGMAARMVELARSPQLCRELGAAGRKRVREHYGLDGLGEQLLAIYRDIARQQDNHKILQLLTERS
jgi:glycosyltransferase involved in cell wall biosynthesis